MKITLYDICCMAGFVASLAHEELIHLVLNWFSSFQAGHHHIIFLLNLTNHPQINFDQLDKRTICHVYLSKIYKLSFFCHVWSTRLMSFVFLLKEEIQQITYLVYSILKMRYLALSYRF